MYSSLLTYNVLRSFGTESSAGRHLFCPELKRERIRGSRERERDQRRFPTLIDRSLPNEKRDNRRSASKKNFQREKESNRKKGPFRIPSSRINHTQKRDSEKKGPTRDQQRRWRRNRERIFSSSAISSHSPSFHPAVAWFPLSLFVLKLRGNWFFYWNESTQPGLSPRHG